MKASTHRLITQAALLQLTQTPSMSVQHSLPRLTRNHQALLDAAGLEDWWPLWQRIAHWHFYRSNEDFPELHLIHQTSELRIRQLEKQLERAESSLHYASILGRILHHLQDMCCPPHAVPIYHGPGQPDPFEEEMERFMPASDAVLAHEPALPCHELSGLYRAAAESTLAYITDLAHGLKVQKNGQAITLPLSAFWPRYGQSEAVSEKGFVQYGPLGKHWGEQQISVADNDYLIPESEYRRLTMELYQRAVSVSRQGIEMLIATYPMV
ncbi:MAG: hypothetical protein ACRCRW_00695 [Aeromonadaceae bacterium]